MSTLNKTYQKAQSTLKENFEMLSSINGVSGLGIGFRIKNNKPTKEICICVEVEKKLPENLMSKDQIIPGSVGGIPIDVHEKREEIPLTLEVAYQNIEEKIETARLQGGLPVSNYRLNSDNKIEVGTLGAFVSVHLP